MKIGILTCVYKRPQISALFLLQIERLRKTYGDLFLPIAVVSTPEDEALFQKHNVETHMYANSPLGAKFQYGLYQLRDRVDAVMLMGSDDLIDNTMIDKLLKEEEELVWPIGLYITNTVGNKKGEVRLFDWFYKNYSSVGRLVKKSLLDRLDWRLWNGTELRAIDHSSHHRLLEGNPTLKMVNMMPESAILDIKSDVNINSYKRFSLGGKITNADYVFSKFSDLEKERLELLCQQ